MGAPRPHAPVAHTGALHGLLRSCTLRACSSTSSVSAFMRKVGHVTTLVVVMMRSRGGGTHGTQAAGAGTQVLHAFIGVATRWAHGVDTAKDILVRRKK